MKRFKTFLIEKHVDERPYIKSAGEVKVGDDVWVRTHYAASSGDQEFERGKLEKKSSGQFEVRLHSGRKVLATINDLKKASKDDQFTVGESNILEFEAAKTTQKPKPTEVKPPNHVELAKEKQKKDKEDSDRQNASALDSAREADFSDKMKDIKDKESKKKLERDHKQADTQAKNLAKQRDRQSQANTNEVLEFGTPETTNAYKKVVPGQI